MKKTNKQLARGIEKMLENDEVVAGLTVAQKDILVQSMNALNASPDDDPLDFFNNLFAFPKESPIILAEYDKEGEVMTINRENGDISKFHGSGTVWSKMPMMQRIPSMEPNLARIHTYITKWGNPYPNAHIKKS